MKKRSNAMYLGMVGLFLLSAPFPALPVPVQDGRPLVLQEMTWFDVAEYLKTNDMVIIPIGSTEQHGPHLPLGTDFYEAAGACKRISARTGVVVAPVVMAGYTHAILLLVREGREPRLQDIFSHMNLFLPLLVFGLVVFIAIVVGTIMLVLPGILVALGVTFFCLYMLPLMTDRRMGLVDAVKESARLAMGDVLMDHVVVVILFLGITAIGGSVFIGSLFTQPFATVFIMSVYLERAASLPPSTTPGPPPRPSS